MFARYKASNANVAELQHNKSDQLMPNMQLQLSLVSDPLLLPTRWSAFLLRRKHQKQSDDLSSVQTNCQKDQCHKEQCQPSAPRIRNNWDYRLFASAWPWNLFSNFWETRSLSNRACKQDVFIHPSILQYFCLSRLLKAPIHQIPAIWEEQSTPKSTYKIKISTSWERVPEVQGRRHLINW